MKRLALLLILLTGNAFAAPQFVALDIVLDAPEPLAAWQFELSGTSMTVVGIENGDSDAFGDAPYYDRYALQSGEADRIIVADYSIASDLPSGRIRLATIHVMIDGDTPEYELKLITATTREGQRLDASITVREQGANHEPS